MDPWDFYRDKWNHVGSELDWKSPQEVQALTFSRGGWHPQTIQLVAVTDQHVYFKQQLATQVYVGSFVRKPRHWLIQYPRGLPLDIHGTVVIVRNPPLYQTTAIVRALVLEALDRKLPRDLHQIVLCYAFRNCTL